MDRAQLQRLRAEPRHAPAFSTFTVAEFGWAIALAFAAAAITFAIVERARRSALYRRQAAVAAARRRPRWPSATLAIGFAQITHQPADLVLFSGQDAFGSLIKQGPALALSTLAFLLLFKGIGLEHLTRATSRRPDLPGPVHRRGRGPARRAPARVLRDPRRAC